MPMNCENPKLMVVLGSGMHSTAVKERGLKPSLDSRIRLNAAKLLMSDTTRNGPTVLLTGGAVFTEERMLSEVNQDWLVRHGIPESKTTVVGGVSTIEEFRAIKARVKEEDIKPEEVIIISNWNHLVARLLAAEEGYNFAAAEEMLWRKDSRYSNVVRTFVCSMPFFRRMIEQLAMSLALTTSWGRELYKRQSEKFHDQIPITKFDVDGIRNFDWVGRTKDRLSSLWKFVRNRFDTHK